MEITLNTKCPYCGTLNHFKAALENPLWLKNVTVTCNSDDGGCGQVFVTHYKFEPIISTSELISPSTIEVVIEFDLIFSDGRLNKRISRTWSTAKDSHITDNLQNARKNLLDHLWKEYPDASQIFIVY